MMKKKLLIAYFSRAGMNYAGGSIVDLPVGNTEIAAKFIARETGGSLFRIEPVTPYPKAYDACTAQAKAEKTQNARPVILGVLPALSDYEAVVLAYPNYWGTMPMPVWTFLETCDFSGRIILPLCTHEGSGMGGSEADLKRLCPSARVVKGLPLYGSHVGSAERSIRDWLRQYELI